MSAARSAPGGSRDATVDLLVVGAGINGTAIARDAALRGLRTTLIDQGDIGGGTSSWSSRLIHGGLRYLEHYDLKLVRESLRERERLLRAAPHLVTPIGFVVPHYRHNTHGAVLVELGMIAYDLLSADKSLPWHRPLGRRATLARVPGLNPAHLRGAARYHDAQAVHPERLCVENAVGASAAGAVVRTWTRATGAGSTAPGVVEVSTEDVLTGDRGTVRARVVVNAAGPWVDRVLDALTPGRDERLIGGTKGSHIVVGPFPGAPDDVVYYEARRDNRLVLVMPWDGRYLIGTTDTRHDGDPASVTADLVEIDYLLAETNDLLPDAHLDRGDVLYAYSGVRPLPWTAPGTAPGSISRNHHVVRHGGGMLSVVGGKLTTYRALAEQTVDAVYGELGRPAPRTATVRLPLPGGTTADWPGFRRRFAESMPDRPGLARRLLSVYGTRAAALMGFAERRGLTTLIDDRLLAGEVAWAMEHEHASTVTDILMRRTMIGLDGDTGLRVAEEVAALAAEAGGWDETRRRHELLQYARTSARLRPHSQVPVP